MTKSVEFEGHLHEFPDDATESEIQDTLNGSSGVLQSAWKGLSEGYPSALKSGINALSEPFGSQPFNEREEKPADNLSEYLGRLGGKGAGYATLAAPFVAGGEAAIPGLVGASLGSGLAGGALTQGKLSERIKDALISAALPVAFKGLASSLRLGKSAITSVKPRKAADVIQEAHDISEAKAVAPFKEASKIAKERDIPSVKINKSIFDLASRAFPKKQEYKDLLKKAKLGDYEALRQVSSDMKKVSRRLDDPDRLLTEQHFGSELDEAAQNIDKTMQHQFSIKGHKDLADLMKEGISNFAEHKNLYYKNPTIAKLVGEEKKVPKNLVKTIAKDETYFKKLREAHPGLKPILKRQEDQELLKKLGIGGLGTAEAIHLVKGLFLNHQDKNE